jgi:hypothetical protein
MATNRDLILKSRTKMRNNIDAIGAETVYIKNTLQPADQYAQHHEVLTVIQEALYMLIGIIDKWVL